jgi:hypothetical protein
MQTFKKRGPSRLLRDEQKRTRDAADDLIFSRDLAHDAPARTAMRDIEWLFRTLLDSPRREKASAMRLGDDISQCGPTLLPDMRAA